MTEANATGTPPGAQGMGAGTGAASDAPHTAASNGRRPAGDGRGGQGGISAPWILLIVLLIVVIAGGAAGGYWLNQRFERAVAAIDARSASSDAALTETRVRSDEALSTARQLDRQVATFASKLTDTQNQQQTLQQLYQDLARNRDDWVMTEAAQTLSSANQQLQLTGNVQLALYALQNADTQLATTDGPQVLEVRRAIASDINTLHATPVVDVAGLALRLDQAIAQVGTLPLTGDVAPAARADSTQAASGVTASDAGAPSARFPMLTQGYWRDFWHRMTTHFGDSATQLVQVRRIDHSSADAMLVSPQQADYLRENVELRLLSARLSLLSRNGATMQADLTAADDALARYFDPSAAGLSQVRDTIADVRRAAKQVAVPTLDASLQALRQYKSRG